MSKLELYLNSLLCDDTFSYAYNSIGIYLRKTGNCFIFRDKLYTARECVIKAIQLNPACYIAYTSLSVLFLNETETMNLHGKIFNRIQLLLESIKIRINFYLNY